MLNANLARASIVYSYIGVVAGTGASQSVSVYLRETISGTSISVISGDSGLYNAAYAVTPFGSLPATGAASITGLTDQAGTGGNFANGIASSSFTASTALLMEGINGKLGTQGPVGTSTSLNGQTVRDVLLGTILVQAGTQATTFQIGQYNALGGNSFTSGNQYDLDAAAGTAAGQAYTGAGSGVTTFTIAAVPEPVGVGLMSVVVIGSLRRRRR